jgi:hypothetical protein
MPETVRERPRLFVTFTAPSFGAVHAKRVHPGNGNLLPCHPRDPKAKCEHGRKAACWFRHPETELRTVGRPLCDDCFDWRGLALWNALAPELWRHTLGVTSYRTLAHLTNMSEAEVKRLVRVCYTKVAEYQARGAVHFHAVIRLDAAPPRDDPEQVAPPPVAGPGRGPLWPGGATSARQGSRVGARSWLGPGAGFAEGLGGLGEGVGDGLAPVHVRPASAELPYTLVA